MIDKNYFRECPSCSKQLGYKYEGTRDKALKLNSICRSCSNRIVKPGIPLSAEHGHKISLGNHKRHGTDPNDPKSKRPYQRLWGKEVKKRDNHTCVYCHISGVKMNAHHILSCAKHPELASLLNNGITLCVPCHKEEHRLNGII